MKRWISHPERYPHRCPWTHQDAPGDGPYLDTGMIYFAARDIDNRVEPDRRESALVISPQALIEAGDLPGSPIVVMSRAAWEAINHDYSMNESMVEQLKLDRDRLENELDDAYARLNAMTDPDTLAETLVAKLDERYARKAGRKPKAAA